MQVEAMFYNPLADGAVHCHLCAHHCLIAPGETGFCHVRINRDGVLYSLAYGETVARHVDPIEKKPLFHFLPDTRVYSIATAGCNFLKRLDIWLEVTTLVVPGSNDSDADLEGIAGFLASVDPQIPWHISRFHPDYRFEGPGPTPIKTLNRAAEIGEAAGLRHVYLGNVTDTRDTLCPACSRPVVLRSPRGVREVRLEDGRCPECGATVAGRWTPSQSGRDR
jgi:hypothetical protein